jgi:WD40 repeat protein
VARQLGVNFAVRGDVVNSLEQHGTDLALIEELWNLQTTAHPGAVRRLAISPDSQTVATGGDDGFVFHHDPRAGGFLEIPYRLATDVVAL